MDSINEYRNETKILEERVYSVARTLQRQSANLAPLTTALENLFTCLSRREELLKGMRHCAEGLRHEVDAIEEAFEQHTILITTINAELHRFHTLFGSMNTSFSEIQSRSDSFVTIARSLAYLAQNAEVAAHHAHSEGKGLAVIARECLILAQQAQRPFKDLHKHAQTLADLIQPILHELSGIAALSARADELIVELLNCLTTVEETIRALQQLVQRAQESSAASQSLKKDISEGMAALSVHLRIAMNMIDDIMLHSSTVNSFSQILETLHKTLLASDDQDSVLVRRHVEKQFNFIVEENRKNAQRVSVVEPPLFPQAMLKKIDSLHRQSEELRFVIDDYHRYTDMLARGAERMAKLNSQIEQFLTDSMDVYQRAQDLACTVDSELEVIQTLVHTTRAIVKKIKTLSIVARIEEGRSSHYRAIVIPIVQKFAELETATENAFLQVVQQVEKAMVSTRAVKREKFSIHVPALGYPDYSDIQRLCDEITTTYHEEQRTLHDMLKISAALHDENATLMQAWHNYEHMRRRISKHVTNLKAIRMSTDVPAIVKHQTAITMCLPAEPLTLNPDKRTDVNSHHIISNFSTGLFQFGENVNLIPALCERVTISDDRTNYTFTLRDNLWYHNGQRVIADHIREGIIRALRGPNFNFFDMISGAKTFLKTNDVQALGIELVNRSTIRIALAYPFTPLLANCAAGIADPYINDALPHGTGPFKITAWEKGKHLLLVAHERYFEGRPSLDEVHCLFIEDEKESYSRFKVGELALYFPTGEYLRRLQTENSHVVHAFPELSVYFLCMNCQKPPFSDQRVRKAIACAIDKRKLVTNALKGEAVVADGLYPPSLGVRRHTPRTPSFNPRQAHTLLQEAGFARGLPDVYILDVRDTPSAIAQAEYIQKDLRAVGIRVELNPLPWHQLLEKTFSGTSLLSLRGWVSDNGDADNFVYPLFHSTSQGRAGNTFFFASPECDKEIETARKTRNAYERYELYRIIEEKILDEAPGVFLYHRLQNIAIQRNVAGVKPHPLGIARMKHACLLAHTSPSLSSAHAMVAHNAP